jgi:type VI protein secretion system component Hcp
MKEQPKRTEATELTHAELNRVTGGTKAVDKSSPNLFKASATGQHFAKATIT